MTVTIFMSSLISICTYQQSRALAWNLLKVENQVAKLRYVELTQCRNVYHRQLTSTFLEATRKEN